MEDTEKKKKAEKPKKVRFSKNLEDKYKFMDNFAHKKKKSPEEVIEDQIREEEDLGAMAAKAKETEREMEAEKL